MRRGLVWLVASCVLVIAGGYMWSHRRQVAESVAVPQGPVADVNTESSEAGAAQGMVKITGPLADYESRQGSGETGTVQPSSVTSLPSAKVRQTTEADRVGDSPVGTSTPILHKTFPVAALVNLPFDIPPHAASPQLRGTYRAFLAKGAPGNDDGVEFLLMNQQQFDALVSGQPSEAVFSVDDAHDQEVNMTLSPTFNQPVRYYLVFRNNSPKSGKKFVEADFRVDF